MTIRRGSAHYRLSLAGGGTDLGEGEGLCITLSLPWKCHVVVAGWHDQFGEASYFDNSIKEFVGCIRSHPILKHLPNTKPDEHFIVTHELPTRVGLGSSAALAVAACDTLHMTEDDALEVDRKATNAGWHDVPACNVGMGCWVQDRIELNFLPGLPTLERHILLFSTGGTHTESRNASELEPMLRQLALAEARKLRDNPTLETLQWCMQRQWERKMVHAPDDVCKAIHAASKTPGFMSAKSTGSRGAGFGVVLTTQREKARDALVECGARVWLV